MFDTIAPTYDRANRWLSFSTDRRWRARAIRAVGTPSTRPAGAQQHVLDLCAGTLDMTIALLRAQPACHVTCVDFSQPMLDAGQAKLTPAMATRTRILCADALQLPLPDAGMDAVMCAFGMRNLPDQPRALQEIARVLVPGGRFVILEFFQPTTWLARLFARTYGHYILPLVGGAISRQPSAYQYLRDSTRRFARLADYTTLLHRHGLVVTSVRNLSGGIASLVVCEKRGFAV